jgi:hypothetical protein
MLEVLMRLAATVSRGSLLAAFAATCLLTAPGRESAGEETAPAAPRSGGLLPERGTAAGSRSSTAAELLRRWDLNADGRIDPTEAEIARSRMRTERVEARQAEAQPFPAIDPVTGRPLEAGGDAPDELLLVPGRPNAAAGNGGRAAAATPGNRGPAAADGGPRNPPSRNVGPPNSGPQPRTGTRAGDQRSDAARAGGPTAAAAQPTKAPDGRQPPQRPQPMTGGSRAGAPAVRPGYGAAGPKVDLNAGRLPAGLPPSRGLPPQGGRMPSRSATAPLSGPQGGRPTGRTAPPPRSSATPTPRISAEEIGGP